jgi:hypothetical protein
MTLYTRQQLLLLVLLVTATGGGLVVDHWRRARPGVVERLERLDRAERPPAATSAPPRRARRPAADDTGGRRGAPRAERARRSGEHPARRPAPAFPLDVNQASAPELARLPGIGPRLAARIVEARPFATLDDLGRVPGLRARMLARARPWLTTLPWP